VRACRAAGSQRPYVAVAGAHPVGRSAGRAPPFPERGGSTPAANTQRHGGGGHPSQRTSSGGRKSHTTSGGCQLAVCDCRRRRLGALIRSPRHRAHTLTVWAVAGKQRRTRQRCGRAGRLRAGATLHCCGDGLPLTALDSPWLGGTPPSSVCAEATPRVVRHWWGGPTVDRHAVGLLL